MLDILAKVCYNEIRNCFSTLKGGKNEPEYNNSPCRIHMYIRISRMRNCFFCQTRILLRKTPQAKKHLGGYNGCSAYNTGTTRCPSSIYKLEIIPRPPPIRWGIFLYSVFFLNSRFLLFHPQKHRFTQIILLPKIIMHL